MKKTSPGDSPGSAARKTAEDNDDEGEKDGEVRLNRHNPPMTTARYRALYPLVF
jgi:hypothetical protein